ncbi:MAG: NADPH-dependent oxidoreductase [Hyphomicrobiales bacterium]|nr:NADPH-dependent oxidoreductase [Hyphomicrobiales bacterium]MCP5371768.1 NADPH-dependent oxidoreductase [Hyphomicrobiales bacterium]
MPNDDDLNRPRPRFPGFAPGDPNPVLDLLMAHRSVRAFTDEPLPEAALDQVLNAAQRAPTSSNMQSYSIVVVDDRDLLKQVRAICGDQPFVSQCAVLLVFCSDISRLVHICEQRGYRFRADQVNTLLVAHGDANLACLNAAVAAQSMGYGTCMLGNVRNNPPEMSDLLGLPKYVYASVGLAIGVADEDKGTKPRLPRSVMVSRNRYDPGPLDTALPAYDRAVRAAGVYDGRREPLNGLAPGQEDPVAVEDYGWCEHTARRLTGAVQDRRRDLGAFLDGKGFSRT